MVKGINMGKNLWQKIKDMPFKQKITAICLMVSLIPMVILGGVFYRQMRETLVERYETGLLETLRQETDHINNSMENYLSVMDFIAADQEIRSALTRDYSRNYDMYLVYRDVIDPLLETVRVLNQGVNSVTFYSNAGIYAHGTSLRMLEEGKELLWYEKTVPDGNTYFSFSDDGKELYLSRRIFVSDTEYTNVLVVSVNIRSAFKALKSIYEDNYGILLLDENGQPVYQYARFSEPEKFRDLSVSEVLEEEKTKGYVIGKQTVPITGWEAILYRPVEEMRSAIYGIVGIVLLLMICSSILVFFISARLAELVVLPVTALSENMKDVEQGNYRLTVISDRKDEVGKLINSFHAMVKQLDYMVNEVLYAKIAFQKYELQVLQSQINPHFLYNTLSMISSRAIMRKQTDISQAAQFLSTFYRTMLNKGMNIISVADELENVKAYISLQQMMHGNSFDVVYEIEESVLKYQILNMLLQPLAENAILHGLDNKEDMGKGILTISCLEEEDMLVFKVMDNGCGMTQEQCRNIITAESRGYGIKNVQQRIRLYYGNAYGITYHSVRNRGSYALLKISKKIEKQTELVKL